MAHKWFRLGRPRKLHHHRHACVSHARPHPRVCTGKCNAACKWHLRNVVSLHLGARGFPSMPRAGAAMRSLADGYRLALEHLDALGGGPHGGGSRGHGGALKGAGSAIARQRPGYHSSG